MDMATALSAIQEWPAADQVELVERIWDDLVDAGWQPQLTDEQKAELDRRLAAADADLDNVFTWDQVEAHLARPR
jgi:putative addiction module component (TIGR02574 family)